MQVSEAVATRRTIRAFLNKPVEKGVLSRVLERAQRAPSGGNVQPWNAVVLTGEPLARLFAVVGDVLGEGSGAWSSEYDIYPRGLEGRYEESRVGIGEAMYDALGISREDREGRRAQFAGNFRSFGAPVLMLVHTPKYMGPPQWSDIGMWLQTVMLLLREEGLDSCPQEAWAIYTRQVRQCVAIPEDHIFFCGVGIGYRDSGEPVNLFPVPRVPLFDAVVFEGF